MLPVKVFAWLGPIEVSKKLPVVPPRRTSQNCAVVANADLNVRIMWTVSIGVVLRSDEYNRKWKAHLPSLYMFEKKRCTSPLLRLVAILNPLEPDLRPEPLA
jgi:hypothetical protein